ncbi:MAG: zinc chelation protein SecC [Gammaproteobacteria bacterium]|nr:zinc chelation protein SecC [Gammaproteobacteria bacterium]
MRSRYSAYVLQRADYLSRTWHASTRPAKLEIDNAQWLGLNVVRTQAGAATDLAGIVEFVARYKLNGKAGRVHETSRFIKQDRQWFYVDAITVTEKPAACL